MEKEIKMDQLTISLSLSDSLDEFRHVLKGIRNLTVPMDDLYLTRFLMARKLNINEAIVLKLYDNMATIKISGYKKIYDTPFQTVLKQRDSFGRKLLYIQSKHWDLSSMSMEEICMSTFFILHEMTSQPETQENGVIILIDNSKVTFSQASVMVTKFSVKEIRRIVMFLQGSYPLRYKGLHLLSTPYIIEKVGNVFKLFLKRKMRNRFHIHGSDLSTLHDKISKDILPQSLGGLIPDNEIEDTQLMDSLYANEERNIITIIGNMDTHQIRND